MTRLAVLLAGIVVLAEAVCAALWFVAGDDPAVALLLGLLAVLLPYLWFICLAAQVSATLHALGHFGRAVVDCHRAERLLDCRSAVDRAVLGR